MTSSRPCGYDYLFTAPLDDLECPLCACGVKDATELQCCGFLACRACLSALPTPLCPHCRAGLPANLPPPSKATARRMLSQHVACPHGCAWKGELRVLLASHGAACPLAGAPARLMACPQRCGLMCRRDAVPSHIRNDCALTTVRCPLASCGAAVRREELGSHMSQKPHTPLLLHAVLERMEAMESRMAASESLAADTNRLLLELLGGRTGAGTSGGDDLALTAAPPTPATPPKPRATPPKPRATPAPSIPRRLTTSRQLDAWKRTFANAADPYSAMPTLWSSLATEDSLYFMAYKYDEENTVDFKTCNLVRGFLQRLDAARKFCFGVMHVVETPKHRYGVVGCLFISGGHTLADVASVCDDLEYYNITKVDCGDDGARARVGHYFCGQAYLDSMPIHTRMVFM